MFVSRRNKKCVYWEWELGKKIGYKELYLDLRVTKLRNYDKLFYSNEKKTKLPA